MKTWRYCGYFGFTSVVRSLPRRNENFPHSPVQRLESHESEAYLEGMKTGLFESEVGVISPSEAYLEGMKTSSIVIGS